MIEKAAGEIKFLQFSAFQNPGIVHGIFSRHGGVSPKPYESLNLGGTTGDTRENIIENRKRIFDLFNRPVESVYDVWQVHGNVVIASDQPRVLGTPHLKADAILTRSPAVTLLMRFADCVPILFQDPVQKVVGIAHAGWQGTVKKVAQTAVQAMASTFGCKPADVIAGIGPSIGPDHYEVGQQVIGAIRESFPEYEAEVLIRRNGKTFFDLWRSNELLLRACGVQQIEISRVCTVCNIADWFSYRAEGQQSGRFAAVIGLCQ